MEGKPVWRDTWLVVLLLGLLQACRGGATAESRIAISAGSRPPLRRTGLDHPPANCRLEGPQGCGRQHPLVDGGREGRLGDQGGPGHQEKDPEQAAPLPVEPLDEVDALEVIDGDAAVDLAELGRQLVPLELLLPLLAGMCKAG